MSSKHGPSKPRDEYLTPRSLVKAAIQKLKERYPFFEPLTCLEPGCGWAAHLDYSLDTFSSIIYTVGVDIYEQPIAPEHEFVHADFLAWETDQRFDLIVTNPPFSLAEQFIQKSISLLSHGGIALFFERYAFFTSKTRRYGLWMDVNLREVWVCVARPAMIGQQTTDSCEYGYFMFDASLAHGQILLDWLDWEKNSPR
jgi:hypothetical protein